MALPGRLIRVAGRMVAWLGLILGLYVLAGWAGSSIPRNAEWNEPESGVDILVETNGVHTAIVMPLITRQKDWRKEFPASDLAEPGRAYTHVSVSWGERDVFLETPTWAELSPVTVLRIIFAGGTGLLHVAHYVRPAPDPTIRPLRISRAEYARLVSWIERRTPPPMERQSYPGYAEHDVFYDAAGSYTTLYTCNQWTSDALAAAGVRTGWWTPFAGGVMKWVPPLAD